MNQNPLRLTMLGTGHAMVTKCYNTCFALQNACGIMLADAGGGNGIIANVEKAGLNWLDFRAMLITHSHTDHILGGIWVVRKINSLMANGKFKDKFAIYGLPQCVDFLKNSCRFLLGEEINNKIEFVSVGDGYVFTAIGIQFTIFDIHSTKIQQIGFKAFFDKDRTLVCLGDEPYNPVCEKYAANADWLMCEAFCLHRDAAKFRPYEKHHSTALDAGRVAEKLHVKNLLLYHTEDTDLKNRKKNYSAEASTYFNGNIQVPDDLEEMEL